MLLLVMVFLTAIESKLGQMVSPEIYTMGLTINMTVSGGDCFMRAEPSLPFKVQHPFQTGKPGVQLERSNKGLHFLQSPAVRFAFLS